MQKANERVPHATHTLHQTLTLVIIHKFNLTSEVFFHLFHCVKYFSRIYRFIWMFLARAFFSLDTFAMLDLADSIRLSLSLLPRKIAENKSHAIISDGIEN